VAATVRTTVASANGSPAALRVEMMLRMSAARSMRSDPRKIRLERRQAFEIVGGSKQIHIGQGRPHAARPRAVVPPPARAIEPDNAAATPTQTAHFLTQLLGRTGVVTIGDDHDRGAGIDDAPCVPPIECGKAFPDLCAATDALCHQCEFVHRTCYVAITQRGRN